jgi:hypothetical protein
MGFEGLLAGTQVEIVGVEDDPSGDLRVFLTHRCRDAYVRIQDDAAKREIRDAWSGCLRVLIPTPPAECVIWPDDPDHYRGTTEVQDG